MSPNRREFLKLLGKLGLTAAAAPLLFHGRRVWAARVPPEAVDAGYFEKLPDGAVRCTLCPLAETLAPGERGRCHSRENRKGSLVTFASGTPCVLNVDPIEKNPLAHVLPGKRVLTVAHAGCNVECLYCQNWEMAFKSPRETNNLDFDPDEALAGIRKGALAGVNFNYTEPTTHLEFNRDLAAAARKQGLRAFTATNGYVGEKPLADFLAVLDAVTVTLKGFSDAFYEKYVGVSALDAVLETMKRVKAAGKWIEVATLVVPGVNDSPDELRKVARWLKTNLGPDTPWHLERFTPAYKMKNLPATPVKTLEDARAIGQKEGLRYVYLANVPLHEGNHTFCPRCKRPVVKRLGFKILESNLRSGKCSFCSTAVAGVWS